MDAKADTLQIGLIAGLQEALERAAAMAVRTVSQVCRVLPAMRVLDPLAALLAWPILPPYGPSRTWVARSKDALSSLWPCRRSDLSAHQKHATQAEPKHEPPKAGFFLWLGIVFLGVTCEVASIDKRKVII